MKKYGWLTRRFYAWSEMQCKAGEDHVPHSWTSEYTVYGPYMCWGEPRRNEYDVPSVEDLREIAGENIRSLAKYLDYFPRASKPAKAMNELLDWLDDDD